IDAASGHLGLGITFRSARHNRPMVKLPLEFGEALVRPISWRIPGYPALGKAGGQSSLQRGCGRAGIPARRSLPQSREYFAIRRKVDRNRLRCIPVRRDLQDRRTTQPAMRDQYLLAELLRIDRSD